MSLNMESEVVGPGESSAAVRTVEGFVSRVFPQVSRQLVRPREGATTVGEATGERPLPGVDPLVSLQVGALLVSLMTVWEVTIVTPLLLSPPTLQGSGNADWGDAETEDLPLSLPLQQRDLHYCPGAHQFQTSLIPLGLRWFLLRAS